jgi:hypothetical protein
MRRLKNVILLDGWLAAALFFHPVHAAAVAFTIDNSQSFISILAPPSVIYYFPMTPQGTGALSTSYSGSINVSLSGSTIQFTGGSTINAHTNGIWQPAAGGTPGSAPADYGTEASGLISSFPPFTLTVFGAMRNISFDVASAVLPLTGTNFTGTNLVFSFASVNATLDYYAMSVHGPYKNGSVVLGGYATNTVAIGSTLTTNGGTMTLSIPIAAQFVFSVFEPNDTKVQFVGQLVATNAITAAAPLIQSISVTNQSVMVTAENVTGQSQLLVSTNLVGWLPATVTTTTNSSGWIIFTTPVNGAQEFFRVQQ